MDNGEDRKLLVLGITGNIGSGKSTVADILIERGFKVINTDNLAKKVIAENPDITNAIANEFGVDAIIDGKLNAAFIASVVFGDNTGKLERLNRITHPPVIDAMIEEIEELQSSGETIIFVESALIYSAGIDEGFDYVIAVTADESIRFKRVAEYKHLSIDEIKRRNDSQISQEKLVSLADFLIENNGTIAELRASVNFLLSIIEHLPPKNFSSSK